MSGRDVRESPPASRVLVVPTGTANLASVIAGLRRAGAEPIVTDDPARVDSARSLVLPGVGSFGASMKRLDALGLVEPLRRRLRDRRPTLAICLGLQLLFEASDESAGVEGLGILPGRITRFDGPPPLRVPQLGWNRITADSSCRRLRDAWVYFANSYRLEEEPTGWAVASADHGGRFVAAIERDDVLACQFHPELSGADGAALLERWVRAVSDDATPESTTDSDGIVETESEAAGTLRSDASARRGSAPGGPPC